MHIGNPREIVCRSNWRSAAAAWLTAVGTLLSLPALANQCPTEYDENDRSIVYATPDGEAGYFKDQKVDRTKKLQDALNELGKNGMQTIQLLPKTPRGQAVFDRHLENKGIDPTQPTGFAYFLTKANGEPDRPLLICGRGIQTLIVGRKIDDLKQEIIDEDNARSRLRAERAKMFPGLASAQAENSASTGTLTVSVSSRSRDMLDVLEETVIKPRLPDSTPYTLADPEEDPRLVRCLRLEKVTWVRIENIALEECWMTAVYIRASRYLTFRGLKIVGSSYAIVAFNGPDPLIQPENASHHILVEDNHWIQDATRYAVASMRHQNPAPPPSPDPCRQQPHYSEKPGDCPGDVWRLVPWGSVHHGSWEPYNGAFFGAAHSIGGVIFRNNVIRNAYNGIRMTARKKKCPFGDCNINVEVYDNDFAFIRDNPVEAEDAAYNWRVFHNTIRNSHSLFSLDGAEGGPVYIFGNVAHFTETPEDLCGPKNPRNNESWTKDEFFEFGTLTKPQRQRLAQEAHKISCGHKRGSILKFGVPEGEAKGEASYDCVPIRKHVECFRYLRNGVYVFNNSWYARSPLAASGYVMNLQHWNNAIEYCANPQSEPCKTVAATLNPNDLTYEHKCNKDDPIEGLFGLRPFRLPTDPKSLVFDCFRADASTRFDFDAMKAVTSLDSALAETPRETPVHEVSGLDISPDFVDAANGNFALKPASPLREVQKQGCIISYDGTSQNLLCKQPAGKGPYRGAYQADGKKKASPGYRLHDPGTAQKRKLYDEHPRIVDVQPRGSATTVTVEFSVPVQWPSGKRLVIKKGNQEPAATCSMDKASTKAKCDFMSPVDPTGQDVIIVLPAGIKASRAPTRQLVTWASNPRNVVISQP